MTKMSKCLDMYEIIDILSECVTFVIFTSFQDTHSTLFWPRAGNASTGFHTEITHTTRTLHIVCYFSVKVGSKGCGLSSATNAPKHHSIFVLRPLENKKYIICASEHIL